jgi:hypothetical protein
MSKAVLDSKLSMFWVKLYCKISFLFKREMKWWVSVGLNFEVSKNSSASW